MSVASPSPSVWGPCTAALWVPVPVALLSAAALARTTPISVDLSRPQPTTAELLRPLPSLGDPATQLPYRTPRRTTHARPTP